MQKQQDEEKKLKGVKKAVLQGEDSSVTTDRHNPLWWSNDDIIVSVLLEPYYHDKFNSKAHKEGLTQDDLLGFAHENTAKVVMRISTPESNKEIAFPFVEFTDIYTKPDKAVEIFENATKRYLQTQGYNVSFKAGRKQKELLKLGKALKGKNG